MAMGNVRRRRALGSRRRGDSARRTAAAVRLHSISPARSEAQYTVGYTAILEERLLFFRDFAFELSHAPFELFNHTIKLLDGSVDVVAENF
jgi:hypothetical protein